MLIQVEQADRPAVSLVFALLASHYARVKNYIPNPHRPATCGPKGASSSMQETLNSSSKGCVESRYRRVTFQVPYDHRKPYCFYDARTALHSAGYM